MAPKKAVKKAKVKLNKAPVAKPIKSELDYMAEDDARTLMRAEEIKRDAKRLNKAKAIAKQKAVEASRVASL